MPLYKSSRDKQATQNNIKKVTSWLEEFYKVDVEFDSDGTNEYLPSEKLISINTKTNYKAQLSTLLHEAGHVLLRSQKKSKLKKQFPSSYNIPDKKWSKQYRVDILREEILAWEKGKEVCEMIGIKIDHRMYHKHLTEAIWSYVKWAYTLDKYTWR